MLNLPLLQYLRNGTICLVRQKKGPMSTSGCLADRRYEPREREAGPAHLVARLDDLPADGRPHDRRPRWAPPFPLYVTDNMLVTSSVSLRRRASFAGMAGRRPTSAAR